MRRRGRRAPFSQHGIVASWYCAAHIGVMELTSHVCARVPPPPLTPSRQYEHQGIAQYLDVGEKSSYSRDGVKFACVCNLHRLCVSLNSRLASNKEERKKSVCKGSFLALPHSD